MPGQQRFPPIELALQCQPHNWTVENVSRPSSTHPDREHPATRYGPPADVPLTAPGVRPTPSAPADRPDIRARSRPRTTRQAEDPYGIAAGANQIRKLAALPGDALAQRTMVVLTTGGVQSNHCADRLRHARAADRAVTSRPTAAGPVQPRPRRRTYRPVSDPAKAALPTIEAGKAAYARVLAPSLHNAL
jgi:hypothetical protein